MNANNKDSRELLRIRARVQIFERLESGWAWASGALGGVAVGEFMRVELELR